MDLPCSAQEHHLQAVWPEQHQMGRPPSERREQGLECQLGHQRDHRPSEQLPGLGQQERQTDHCSSEQARHQHLRQQEQQQRRQHR